MLAELPNLSSGNSVAVNALLILGWVIATIAASWIGRRQAAKAEPEPESPTTSRVAGWPELYFGGPIAEFRANIAAIQKQLDDIERKLDTFLLRRR